MDSTISQDDKDKARSLLENKKWCDCTFLLGPNEETIRAHRILLAFASSVLENLVDNVWSSTLGIRIPDVTPDSFKSLLEYIYTGTVSLTTFDQAIDLAYAAIKFKIPLLFDVCVDHVKKFLRPDNVCRAYEYAKLHGQRTLMDKCLELIRNQTSEVLEGKGFEEAQIDTVVIIFEQEYLNIDSEVVMFKALERYAAKHNLRRKRPTTSTNNKISENPTIEDALMNIRFLTMEMLQFEGATNNTHLLTETEKLSILRNICHPYENGRMPDGFTYSTISRQQSQPERNTETTVQQYTHKNDFRLTESESDFKRSELRFYFNNGNKDIMICGLEVSAKILKGYEGLTTYYESMCIYLKDDDKETLYPTINFRGQVRYNSVIEVLFHTPIKIIDNKWHTICVDVTNGGCFPIAPFIDGATNGVKFTMKQNKGLVRSIIFMS